MPAFKNLLHRAASNRHVHRPLGGDDHSDDGSGIPLPPVVAQKRVSADLSCTETSFSSNEDSAEAFEQFDAYDLPGGNHASAGTPTIPPRPVSPCVVKSKAKPPSLASFLDHDLAKTSTSTTRLVGKNGRASKGRSRRISSGRSVCSLPTQRTTTTASRGKVVSSSAAPQSPNKSSSSSPTREAVEPGGSSSRSTHEGARSRVATRAAAMSAPPSAPLSAPTGRKQKVTLRNLPRAPGLGPAPSTVKGPHDLYRSRSTRELLKEYNTILDDFDDSTRGLRSQALDLLEEYDQILTEYDDSARADRNTPFTTGWR